MKTPTDASLRKTASDAAGLRRRAEQRLQSQRAKTGPARPEADLQRLVHELQVHQIELELQNEELQEARSGLARGLEKYRDLFDFAPVGFLTLDREGTIREVNLAAASLLGIARSHLLQRRLGLYVAAADRAAFGDFLARVQASRGRERCEVKMVRDGAASVHVRMEASAVAGKECEMVLEDLTEHIQAEADRLILNKLESTGILAGGIAHDFNNLLTVILLNLELSQETAAAGQKVTPFLEKAKAAAWTAHNLTQQILTFAEGGTPVRQRMPLAGLILESSRAALNGSPVRCEFLPAADLWPVNVNAGQIGQVIRNLVQNAREAMPHLGVVCVRAENVALGAGEKPPLPPGDYVRVSIADQGGGIAPEVLPRIFDPYFSTKERGSQKGMGLGLTICHSVMQKHGGTITVTSEVGIGSTFDLLLPAHQNLPEPSLRKQTAPARPGSGRILVMDDEESVRKVVGTTLERLGHEVALATDGAMAIQLHQNAKQQGQPFDVVLLDLTVHTGLGGQETLRALRKLDPAVPAIVMTGYSGDPVLLEPEHHGFQGGLTKPFNRDQLQEILARVMQRRPAP